VAEPVLVLLPEPGSPLASGSLEALGAGRALAAAAGAPLVCAVLGGAADAAAEAGERGADRVLVARLGDRPSGDALVAAGAAALAASGARVAMVARGAHVLELTHRLAARLDGGSVTGAVEVRAAAAGDDVEVVASVFGGAARAVYRFPAGGPRVIGLAPGAGEAPARDATRTAEVSQLAVEAPADARVTVVAPAAAASGPRLEDARVVVSGGRGLKEGANYALVRELAELLGGMAGASRAIVDDKWATPAEQVGLTGKIVSPDLYIAAGISGASQHMVGCSSARTLVAINTDAQAPIFQYAQFGIVDDCTAVLPELIRLVREGSSRS